MQSLKLGLEHCYGIRRLEKQFSFNHCPAVAIYAPNGAMKSSLAKTFQDISEGKDSADLVFPDRDTKRLITDEKDVSLEAASILVVRPYDEDIGGTEKTSTLLVNAQLRKKYERLNSAVEDAKKRFLDAMKQQSSSKKNLEKEISSTFTPSDDTFTRAILRIYDEVMSETSFPFAEILYDVVFDDRVLEFLNTEGAKNSIEDYIKKYNELIDRSTYFKRGVFNYYNASVIAKTLADNGFFKASHTVSLNAGKSTEIKSRKQLEQLIQEEKDGISSDPELREAFQALEKLLTRNVSMRGFQSYISENEEILPALANIAEFKELVWKSYFGANKDLFQKLVEEIRRVDKQKRKIEKAAGRERTAWEEVIEIFNTRFFVPFELVVKNKIPVMIGMERIPKLGFTFKDGEERKDVEREDLLEVLSTGEKKAFYVLNVLFEIQVRVKSGQKTIMIIDDIADSFDYKNKYAIIQYLKDISEKKNFRQLILTHNFDFFRTVQSRFVSYNSCFLAKRNEDGIKIEPATGIKNVFVKDWKQGFASNPRKRIASIPFMRNLIEYTVGENSEQFKKLTSLLHIKTDTSSLTEADLFEIYRNLFSSEIKPANGGTEKVLDLIFQEADACLVAEGGINLENKIVLSIAARLKAEQYMITRINEPNFVAEIHESQTTKLLSKFKEKYPNDGDAISSIDKVVLMTPENIHLNSFMYEPIMDLSDEHLRKVYEEVRELCISYKVTN